ncbi:MAG: phosphotransferase [Parvularculales bacterium]
MSEADVSARKAIAADFLEQAGWGGAHLESLRDDASHRHYARLYRKHETAILMDSPPMGPVLRPYAIKARLALDCEPFMAVGDYLHSLGLGAPTLLAHDLPHGFLLLEDLGNNTYLNASTWGGDNKALLTAAVEVLVHLHSQPLPEALPVPGGGLYRLPLFGINVFLSEVALFTRWYRHEVLGNPLEITLFREEQKLWRALYERYVKDEPDHLMLRDFHSPNLMWQHAKVGVARVGILDYQDALLGPEAYDLVSLLQDARQDVPAILEAHLLDKYISAMTHRRPDFNPQTFQACYAVLAAQRSIRIMGVFTRLWKRDNKHAYREHLPRMADYLTRNLAHPALKTIARRFSQTPWYPSRQDA